LYRILCLHTAAVTYQPKSNLTLALLNAFLDIRGSFETDGN